MTSPIDQSKPLPTSVRHGQIPRSTLSLYFGTVVKNVIGWILLVAAPVIGVALPGPGGIPLFIIGFALVTFPGKRRLTSRVMRGRPVLIDEATFTFVASLFSVVVLGSLVWAGQWYISATVRKLALDPGQQTGLYAALILVILISLPITWLMARLSIKLLNFFIRAVPRVRRMARPWMRRRGLNLLPPRRKLVGEERVLADENEILIFSETYGRRWRAVSSVGWPWLRRATTLGITFGIFYFVLRPIWLDRTRFVHALEEVSIVNFALATLLFAAFLGLVRATSWRWILAGLARKVPYAPALRVWTTSELARYLPGAVWQVIGRIRLIRPYGVRGSVCSTSQALELAIFLLANALVAIACLIWLGYKNMPAQAAVWMTTALVLAPLLSLLVVPPVFNRLANAILRFARKPPLQNKLRTIDMLGLLGFNVAGLIVQSFAVWLVVSEPLELPLAKWWVVAGAYCLAWMAGFIAVWAPAGIGVRELVFVYAMSFALPPAVRLNLDADQQSTAAVLSLLAILLRLWTLCAEAVIAFVAYTLDFRGAFNLPGAPGRLSDRQVAELYRHEAA